MRVLISSLPSLILSRSGQRITVQAFHFFNNIIITTTEMESMISLEQHAVETDNFKQQMKTKAGPSSLYRVFNALCKKFKAVKAEANSKNIDNMIRSKREIFLARKQKQFDDFNEEIEGMLFAMSDASSTVLEYHHRMQTCKAHSWRYLQESEARIAIQKDKLMLSCLLYTSDAADE